MKIKISEIKENPFRKELGPYNEEQIARIIESYQMSDFGSNNRFEVRKNSNHYELIYGHHRLLALRRFYGDDLEIEIIERNYNDNQMLKELLRENLTRKDDWQFKMLSLVLVKKYLKFSDINEILHFLSKDSKVISEDEAKKLLQIHENLSPELLKKVKNMQDNFKEYDDTDYISIKQAEKLSSFEDKEEQHDLAKALRNSIVQNVHKQIRLLSKYRNAPEELKKMIRSGETDLIALEDRETRTKKERSQTFEQTEKIKTLFSANKQALYIYSCLSDAIKNIEKLNRKKLDEKTKTSLRRIYRKTVAVLTAEISEREVIDVQ